ncbi:MAG: endolytic transglycosylase MltG [Porphyromonadaceae bacterium]|nr:endolytic transglycosylase MltG [Porphyromonadaceae bacterium]
MQTASKGKVKLCLAIALLVLVNVGIIGGCIVIKRYRFDSFASNEFTLYIGDSTTLDSVFNQLRSQVSPSKVRRLERLTATKGFPSELYTGAYRIKPGVNVVKIYEQLAQGKVSPVRIVFNNLRTKEDFARSMSQQLKLSAEELLVLMDSDAFCQEKGFTPQNIPAMLLPDSYEVYWNTSAANLLLRMEREYHRFWNEERLDKAHKAGLSPIEVATLASIVEEETNVADEMPTIAGLYLNRLRRNIPLQADPTIKFAIGDFGVKRILKKHLDIDSPYNTYKYYGLPPGPIRIASKQAIEAVLNYKRSNYLFMCAKEDMSGRHNFAATLAEHNANARKYHKALNELKIMK